MSLNIYFEKEVDNQALDTFLYKVKLYQFYDNGKPWGLVAEMESRDFWDIVKAIEITDFPNMEIDDGSFEMFQYLGPLVENNVLIINEDWIEYDL